MWSPIQIVGAEMCTVESGLKIRDLRTMLIFRLGRSTLCTCYKRPLHATLPVICPFYTLSPAIF